MHEFRSTGYVWIATYKPLPSFSLLLRKCQQIAKFIDLSQYVTLLDYPEILHKLDTKTLSSMLGSFYNDPVRFKQLWNMVPAGQLSALKTWVATTSIDSNLFLFTGATPTITTLHNFIRRKDLVGVTYSLNQGITPTVSPVNSYIIAGMTGSKEVLQPLLDVTKDEAVLEQAKRLLAIVK
jgi:hypothetical protein